MLGIKRLNVAAISTGSEPLTERRSEEDVIEKPSAWKKGPLSFEDLPRGHDASSEQEVPHTPRRHYNPNAEAISVAPHPVHESGDAKRNTSRQSSRSYSGSSLTEDSASRSGDETRSVSSRQSETAVSRNSPKEFLPATTPSEATPAAVDLVTKTPVPQVEPIVAADIKTEPAVVEEDPIEAPWLVFTWALLDQFQFLALTAALAAAFPLDYLRTAGAFSWANLWLPLVPDRTAGHVRGFQSDSTTSSLGDIVGFARLTAVTWIPVDTLFPSAVLIVLILLVGILCVRGVCHFFLHEKERVSVVMIEAFVRTVHFCFLGVFATAAYALQAEVNGVGDHAATVFAVIFVVLLLAFAAACARASILMSVEGRPRSMVVQAGIFGLALHLKPNRRWFVILVLVRKILLATLVGAMQHATQFAAQIGLVVTVLVVYLGALVYLRPFQREVHFYVETVCAFVSLIHACLLFGFVPGSGLRASDGGRNVVVWLGLALELAMMCFYLMLVVFLVINHCVMSYGAAQQRESTGRTADKAGKDASKNGGLITPLLPLLPTDARVETPRPSPTTNTGFPAVTATASPTVAAAAAASPSTAFIMPKLAPVSLPNLSSSEPMDGSAEVPATPRPAPVPAASGEDTPRRHAPVPSGDATVPNLEASVPLLARSLSDSYMPPQPTIGMHPKQGLLARANTQTNMKRRPMLKLDLSKLPERDAAEQSETERKLFKQRMNDPICSDIVEWLSIGSDTVARNTTLLTQSGVTHVVNCAGGQAECYAPQKFSYLRFVIDDSPLEDINGLFYPVLDYVEFARKTKGRIFFHCMQGISRSAALAIAALMFDRSWTFDEALAFAREKRAVLSPNIGFQLQLSDWHDRRAKGATKPLLYRVCRQDAAKPEGILVHKRVGPPLDPTDVTLDPRTCYILHMPPGQSTFLWIGRQAPSTFEATAHYVVGKLQTYEHASQTLVEMRQAAGAPTTDKHWLEFTAALGQATVPIECVTAYDCEYN